MVQAMDIFMITWQDVTKPRENCNLKLPDVFVSLPTGSGKSFIFQAAPICVNYKKRVNNSVALVISPIKALVDDQVMQLKAKGISASFVRDVNTKDENLSVIFASPESILENGTWPEKILN